MMRTVNRGDAATTPHRWPSLGTPVAAVRRKPGERSFGLTVGGVLLAIAAFSAWRGHPLRAETTGAIGALLVVAAALRPSSLAPLSRVWMRIGGALGWFNSRVLLTLIFVVIFAPFGLVARLFGKDPLDRRPGAASRWSKYPERYLDPKHYERMY